MHEKTNPYDDIYEEVSLDSDDYLDDEDAYPHGVSYED